MKNIENKGFLTTLDAVGRCVPVKTPAALQKANKINGFVHIPYGTAMVIEDAALLNRPVALMPLLRRTFRPPFTTDRGIVVLWPADRLCYPCLYKLW